MPVADRFKVSITENSDNYRKYGSDKNVSSDSGDGVTDRLLPNSQDVSLQSAMETGLFIITFESNYCCGVTLFDNIRVVLSSSAVNPLQ